MVDIARRKTLVALTGTALVGALPAFAALPSSRETTFTPIDISSGELTITLDTTDPQAIVTIHNHTDQLIIVRHVLPGIVHSGGKTYDINSVFTKSAYAVSAGKSRRIFIQETRDAPAKRPQKYYSHKPGRAAAVVVQSVNRPPKISTRSFYA